MISKKIPVRVPGHQDGYRDWSLNPVQAPGNLPYYPSPVGGVSKWMFFYLTTENTEECTENMEFKLLVIKSL